jgi:DNA-binding SARP family transcriptional activator/tetratricopeptide (TPR) repeat protein
MLRVEMSLLGPFRVTVDGEERRITAQKQRALVARLGVRSPGRSRELVAAELWPDSNEERSRQSLRHALYEIHVAVGAKMIGSAHNELLINERVIVDVREFERALGGGTDADLDRAFALYRGDLCSEVEGIDGEAERVRLRGLFAAAGEMLAARSLTTDARGAAAIARRVIEIDPYREEAHRVLLRALAATGDLAGAAAHYKRLTTILEGELGVEPSAETKQLYASLGRQAPRAHRAQVRRPSLEPPAALVGRRTEYGKLMAVVSDAIDGNGRTALVIGEAGTGKSRLLEEIARVAELHGLQVVHARATAAEGALPFQLWVDALAPRASEVAALPSPWPAVLAALLPETAHGELGTVGPELRRTRLFEGVARLLGHLATVAPTLVVLDDLHHADPDSKHLFHYVARTLTQRRIAMVVASRPVIAGSPLAEARASLEARGELATVELGPLAPTAVNELLLRFGVGPDTAMWLAPRIATWTGGNPFFVLELLRALIGQDRLRDKAGTWTWSAARPADDEPLTPDLPSTVIHTIITRVGELPQPTRRLLDLVSVIGLPTRLEVVASVAARDELAVAEELAPAFEAGLIREAHEGAATTLTFAHELVRDATYQRIPLTVRAAIHRRAATALERFGATSRAIAYHLTAGGDAARGAELWLSSGHEAEARFAHDDAIRSYRAALDAFGPSSPRRSEVLIGIADAHMRRGSAPAGVAAYDEALATNTDDVEERIAVFTRIAAAARYYERHPRALEYAETAVGYYRSSGQSEALADALVGLAWVRYLDRDANATYEAAEEARLIARSIGAARTEALALHVSIWARWLSGEMTVRPDENDLERLVASLGDDESVATLLGLSSTALARRGRSSEAVAPARLALEMARRVGSLRAQLEAGEDLAGTLRVSGSWREAVAVADEVRVDVASLELAGPPRLLGELVIALALCDDSARALALAEELIANRSAATQSPVHGSPALEAASALMMMGRIPERDLINSQRPSCQTCQVWWHVVAGRQAALVGDHQRALTLADALERLIADNASPTNAGGVPHIRALALRRAGSLDEADKAADEARVAYRTVGRRDSEVILDRDLAFLTAAIA